MVATFRSLRQPLLLLVSIPFAATGAILLQAVSGIPLGVASIIGVLMLIGIVVTNAIVLVDLVNQYRDRGMSTRESVVHGASRRLRPILMTAVATIFALLPLGIGITGPRRLHLAAARDHRDRRARVIDDADARGAADALLPGRGCEGAARGSQSGEGGTGGDHGGHAEG